MSKKLSTASPHGYNSAATAGNIHTSRTELFSTLTKQEGSATPTKSALSFTTSMVNSGNQAIILDLGVLGFTVGIAAILLFIALLGLIRWRQNQNFRNAEKSYAIAQKTRLNIRLSEQQLNDERSTKYDRRVTLTKNSMLFPSGYPSGYESRSSAKDSISIYLKRESMSEPSTPVPIASYIKRDSISTNGTTQDRTHSVIETVGSLNNFGYLSDIAPQPVPPQVIASNNFSLNERRSSKTESITSHSLIVKSVSSSGSMFTPQYERRTSKAESAAMSKRGSIAENSILAARRHSSQAYETSKTLNTVIVDAVQVLNAEIELNSQEADKRRKSSSQHPLDLL
eukprot:NODE_497_length_7708_cov_0.291760.p2 type:complete len:341 gc:universal NODE_497_length_7708_cov_0.291760:2291-3313(+)